MGITERKERQKKEMRSSILTAAWQLVNDDGWQSLSIRKIADAIEYSVPVVYDHFENKEAIIAEFNKQGFNLLNEKLKQAKAQHTDPSRQLEEIAYAYWDFAFDHKEYYQVMYGLGIPTCESARSKPELMEFTNVIWTTIDQIQKENNVQESNLLKMHTFWSMIHGLVSINLVAPSAVQENISHDELNKMVLSDFIKGFIKGLKE